MCGTRRKSKHRAGLLALRSLEHRLQVWVLVPPHPSLPNQMNAILSNLLWPLRHVLFLTPSWNWLSSSKNQALFLLVPLLDPQLPVKRELIYIFIYLLFVLGWLCPRGSDVAIAGWVSV